MRRCNLAICTATEAEAALKENVTSGGWFQLAILRGYAGRSRFYWTCSWVRFEAQGQLVAEFESVLLRISFNSWKWLNIGKHPEVCLGFVSRYHLAICAATEAEAALQESVTFGGWCQFAVYADMQAEAVFERTSQCFCKIHGQSVAACVNL